MNANSVLVSAAQLEEQDLFTYGNRVKLIDYYS